MPIKAGLAVEAGERAFPAALAGDPLSHVTHESCRVLFGAVLLRCWNDALEPDQSVRVSERLAALRWFGSAGFYEVCELAGVDGDDVLSAYRAARRRQGQPQ